jgi:hypothetical protein
MPFIYRLLPAFNNDTKSKIMKRNTIIILLVFTAGIGIITTQSCASAKITDKSGSQLWGENCLRCHNSPPSSAFTNVQWEIVNTHMRERAMLTETEYKKILDFLQAGD